MLKSRSIFIILAAAGLAGFAFGLVRLYQLRFSAGDIYPPYSSLRTDPLGARALYESLAELRVVSVNRLYQPLDKLDSGQRPALLFLGTAREALAETPEADYRELQHCLRQGDRIVISLLPLAGMKSGAEGRHSFPIKTRRSKADPQTKSRPGGGTNQEAITMESVSLLAKFGVGLSHDNLATDDDGVPRPELAKAEPDLGGLDPLVSWHSAFYFSGLDGEWRTIYRRKDHPVLIERKFGAGSLVLATDSYFLSNEALRKERHADLLVWLLGGRGEIVFDETHLGVEEHPGIAGLMRRYRLEWLAAGLLVLAGLFIWKNAVSLVPAAAQAAEPERDGRVLGKEGGAGFASLLRRGIPVQELALTCFEEWQTACARNPRFGGRLDEINTIVAAEKARPPGSRRPLETCQLIQQILTRKN